MAELPYRPEHVNDAIANSEELTNEELGAYVRLQRALWKAGGYLPDDDQQLARFARAHKRWGMIRKAVLRKLTVADGKISCPDVLVALLITRERRSKAVEAALAKHAKARGSEGTRNSISEGPRTSSKPLELQSPGSASAASEHLLGACNQNQKNIDNRNLSASGTAAGGRAEPSRSAVILNNALNADLFVEGVELLCARVSLRRLAARSQINKWLAELGDAQGLADILAAAATENLRGPQFVNVVGQRVSAGRIERERGLSLPFGPNIVSES